MMKYAIKAKIMCIFVTIVDIKKYYKVSRNLLVILYFRVMKNE
ncbi:hypothetical protein [Clostridium botulinum]|nr:hypothetical protein [Clostridium botulinum]